MENPVEEIKAKADIVSFIGSYIALKKAGKNFKAVCPFHQEKTPSFVISPERQIWHCFGSCGEGGDVIKFFMKWENVSFFEAVKELAHRFGIKTDKISFEDKAWQKRERLIAINNLAKDYFHYLLIKTDYGKRALDYLNERKINLGTVKKFELGYAPSSWDSLVKFLKRKKYNESEIYEAGLVVRSERGSFYDRFRGRLVFPIKDSRANTIGFSGRALDNKEKSAKYINTPESPLYHKRESLYGIHLAKEAIKKNGNVILVEGEFDMITPYQAGIENIVAIKGSAVTVQQLNLLKRYTTRINLSLDADSAGEEAIRRGIEEAENMEFDIGVVIFKGGKDPDEAVRANPDEFKKAVKKAQPIYDFIINFFTKKFPEGDAYAKKNIVEGVVPYLARIRNPVVQSYSIRKLAENLNIDEKSIQSLIRKHFWEKKKNVFLPQARLQKKEIHREIILQKYLLSLIFQCDNPYKMIDQAMQVLQLSDFSIVSYAKILNLFLDFKKNNPVFARDKFDKLLVKELKAVYDELYLFASADLGLENENFDKIVAEIRKYSLKRKIKEMMTQEKLNEEKEKELAIMNESLKELEKKTVKL